MTPLDLRPGEVVADYRLERELGRGAMGVVFLATHQRLGYRVAIKFLEPYWAQHPEVLERFEREGRAALTVKHPAVVDVHGFGTTGGGIPYLVMEHLEGITLEQLSVRAGALPPPLASAVLAPVLGALGAAHAAGVVHRDVKPSNVMLTSGARNTVKLVDFGIARVAGGQRLTRAGAIMGTPDYMAPEQARDAQQASAASDLYAVGVMAFELLSGRLPFEGSNAAETMRRVLTERAPALQAVAGKVDPGLSALVDALLAKDPRARPASAAQVRARLVELAPPDEEGLWALVKSDAEFGAAPTRMRPSVKPVTQLDAQGPVPEEILAAAPTAEATPHAGALAVERQSGAAPTEPAPAVAPRSDASAPRAWRAALGVLAAAGIAAGAWAIASNGESPQSLPETAPLPPRPTQQTVQQAPVAPERPAPASLTAKEEQRNKAALEEAEQAMLAGRLEDAWKALGACQVEKGPCPEGAKLAGQLEEEEGNRRLLEAAKDLFEQGRPAEARKLVKRAEKTRAFAARVEALKGRTQKKSTASPGAPAEAWERPSKRTEVQESLRRAVAEMKRRNYAEAKNYLQACISLDPTEAACHERLEVVCRELRDRECADRERALNAPHGSAPY